MYFFGVCRVFQISYLKYLIFDFPHLARGIKIGQMPVYFIFRPTLLTLRIDSRKRDPASIWLEYLITAKASYPFLFLGEPGSRVKPIG